MFIIDVAHWLTFGSMQIGSRGWGIVQIGNTGELILSFLDLNHLTILTRYHHRRILRDIRRGRA